MPIYCSSTLRMTPTDSTGSFPADTEGAIYYDDSEAQLKHYDGSDWGNVNQVFNVDRPGDGQYDVDSYTKLLIHSNTSNNSTTFTDSGTTGHSISRGGAYHTGSEKKIGATSMYFDGSNDYISAPDDADWDFEDTDITIDFWIRFVDVSVASSIWGQSNGGGNQLKLGNHTVDGSTWYYHMHSPAGSPYNISFSWSPSNDTWYHTALVREGDSWKLFVDGQQTGGTQTQSAAFKDIGGTFRFGQDGEAWQKFNGYLDEIRVSKGIARWTSNFAVY